MPLRSPLDADLLLTNGDFVRALARALVRDENEADDAAQDLWLSLARRGGNVKNNNSRSFLSRAISNLVKLQFRRAERRGRRESAAARSERLPSAADVYEREAARRRVVEAVMALPEPQRIVILLKYFEQLPPREIAARLGEPVETVRTRQKRAMELLKLRLDADFGGRGHWSVALLPIAEVITVKTTTKISTAALICIVLGSALWRIWSEKNTSIPENIQNTRELAAADDPRKNTDTPEGAASRSRAGDIINSPEVGVVAQAPIRGRVVDAAGAPVEGSRIILFPSDRQRPVRLDEKLNLQKDVLTTSSDRDGNFTVALAGGAPLYTIFADAQGLGPALFEPALPGNVISIILNPAVAIEGRTLDYEGQPVAGARVRWMAVIGNVAQCKQSVTDEKGNYKIVGLPSPRGLSFAALQHHYLYADADGYAPLRQRAPGAPADSTANLHLDLYLPKGASLAGRVIDAETGAALAGAKLTFWSVETSGSVGRRFGPSVENPFVEESILSECISKEDGTFIFDRVPTWGLHWRNYRNANMMESTLGFVSSAAPGHARAVAEILVPDEGQKLNCEIRCWPSAIVRGRVVGEKGEPVEGAHVFVNIKETDPDIIVWGAPDRRERPGHGEYTDSNGNYNIEVAAKSAEDLSTVVTAFTDVKGAPRREAKVTISVRAGETVDVPDLSLISKDNEPAAIIKVVDGKGAPLWGAFISPYAESWDYPTLTKSDGRARTTYFPGFNHSAPKPVRLFVRFAGMAIAPTPEFTPSTEKPPEVTVTLEPAHSVRGKVYYQNGEPGARAVVRIANGAVPIDDLIVNKQERFKNAPPLIWIQWTTSAADGSFEFTDLPSGTFHVIAWANSNDTNSTPGEEPFTTVTGVAADSTDIKLVFSPEVSLKETLQKEPGAKLYVSLRDESSGAPVLRCYVRAVLANDRRTRREGNLPARPGVFILNDLFPGTWIVKAEAPGVMPAEVEVKIEAGVVPDICNINLQRGVTVRGRLRDSAGTPIKNGKIIFQGDGLSATGEIDAAGNFNISGVRRNVSYRVNAVLNQESPEGFVWWSSAKPRTVRFVDSDADVIRDFVVSRAGGLVVRVHCKRLPASSWEHLTTAEQTAAANRSKLEIRDAEGTVILTKSPIDQNGVETVVARGEYTVRIEVDGAKPVERIATVGGERLTTTVEIDVE